MVHGKKMYSFAVWNNCGDDSITKEFLGYLYLNLFKWDGKYNHWCHFDIQPVRIDFANDGFANAHGILC